MNKREYASYLAGDHWRATRAKAIRLAGYHCQNPRCELDYLKGLTRSEREVELDDWLPPNAYRLEVHHLTYDRLGHESPDDLIVLCPGCHAKQHGIFDVREEFSTSVHEAMDHVISNLRKAS